MVAKLGARFISKIVQMSFFILDFHFKRSSRFIGQLIFSFNKLVNALNMC